MTQNHPWQNLNPEAAMVAVESIIGEPLSAVCLPRNSYINRVYEMEKRSGDRIIVKFYRPGRWTQAMINGEHQFLFRLASLELPVITPQIYAKKTLFMLAEIPFAIFPKKGGRAIDELDQDTWEEIGRLLARVHNIGELITDSGRMVWQPEIATRCHYETLVERGVVPDSHRVGLDRAVQTFIQTAQPDFSGVPQFLIHGDCHLGNLIYRPGESLVIVDFDDCVVGPAVQDVWMLLPDDPEHCRRELAWFRSGYNTFRDFPDSSLRLVSHLKMMRQLHFAAWCAIQAQDPDFTRHFPDWGSAQYWTLLVRDIMK